MFQLTDGRDCFYQWDVNRKLVVLDDDIVEVHFCNKTDDCSLVCEVYSIDDINLVDVPNILLQSDWPINVYAYDGNYTKHSACFKVMKRTKPADYVYTETEIKRWEDLEGRIAALEENGGGSGGGSNIQIDTTLTVSGAAADAKAVGEKFDTFRKYHNGWIDTNTGVYIDTTAKTLTFGANTYITYGNQLLNVSNTVHDISTMIGGSWVYLDYSKQPYTLTKDRNTQYTVFLGALWKPNHLADFHMDKTKLYVDGMPIGYVGKYHNKTINCLGDSMTEGVGTTKAYHQWFSQLCGFKTINVYGLGGSCIAPKVDEVPTWEAGIESFYERYEDMGAADVITVFGGVNDWTTGRELGSINDDTTNTFYGAMKALCAGLIAKYPSGNIYVFSSPQCDYINRPANDLAGTAWAGNTEGYNRKGYKLQDYANAMAEVCAIYGVPFCSLTNNLFYGLSGVLGNHKGTSGVYGSDALHPNMAGHAKIAMRMADFINSGSGNAYVPNEPIATKTYVDNAIANLPSGGSAIPKAMELIASGTNTEPVRRFKITADNDGNAFELTKAKVYIKNIVFDAEASVATNKNCFITIGNAEIRPGLTLGTGNFKDVIAYADNEGTAWAAQGTGDKNYSYGQTLTAISYAPNQTITMVDFATADASVRIAVGATYEVWGVRK